MRGEIRRAIQSGVTSEKDLPYYTEVERYWTQFEAEAEWLRGEPKRREEAAELHRQVGEEMKLTRDVKLHQQRLRRQQAERARVETAERRAGEARPPWEVDERREGMVEQLRSQLLGQLTGSEDWINKWIVENWERRFPYEREYADIMSGISGQPTYEEVSQLRGIEYLRGQWEEPSKLPPAPEWMTKFAPGLQAGQPITRQTIPAPSGQQWAALGPARRGMLAGYAQWGGQDLQDILGRTQQMLPRQPVGTGGGARGRPQRQRVSR